MAAAAVAARWLVLLMTCIQCSGRQLPYQDRLAAGATDGPAPCYPTQSAGCRWEALRERTVPHERRHWPADASPALVRILLAAGPSSEHLLSYCQYRRLVCVHPLCPCRPQLLSGSLGDTPSHDDMCDMLCGIGEGGSECECMKPPAAAGPASGL